MMKKRVWVGVDVGSRELVVAVERNGKRDGTLSFENTAEGHRKLIHSITKRGASARVVLEATGVYGFDLALALERAPRVEVMVANPRAVSHFGRASLQRSKTDVLDAEVILEFAKRMPFEPWIAPARETLDLRAISRRMEALAKTATQEKNRLHASHQSAESSELVRADIASSLEQLATRVARLRDQALQLIASQPHLRDAFGHLISVKGIADVAGIQILAEIAILPKDMNVRQWVAHAGLDPRQFQSGTSVHKPARISKTGNTHLRRALFMPALVAVQHEPHVTAFYEKLLGRGKTKMQANVAVMRKLLHAIYGMLTHDQDFKGEKFYAIGA
jgi:transposase